MFSYQFYIDYYFILLSNVKPESKKRGVPATGSVKTPISAKKAKIDATTPQKTGTLSLSLRWSCPFYILPVRSFENLELFSGAWSC